MFFNFSTGVQRTNAEDRSRAIAALLRRKINISAVGIGPDTGSVVIQEAPPTDTGGAKYPLIIVINGTGGTGKGTLIKDVRFHLNRPVIELSSIDPVRQAAAALIKETNGELYHIIAKYGDPGYLDIRKAGTIIRDKDSFYRDFLHNLKNAWIAYNNGPERYLEAQILNLVTDVAPFTEQPGPMVDQRNSLANSDGVIFVNIREPENIQCFRDAMLEYGFPCVTMLVDGHVDPNGYTNHGDRDVNNFNYDVTVNNHGTEEELDLISLAICINLLEAIYSHCVTRPDNDALNI